MVFILLIRSLDQLSRPGRAATQVCISGAGPSGLFPPDSWLGHPALGQTGLPPLRGLGAFHKTRAGSDIRQGCRAVLALYGILKAYCLAQIRGSKLWADCFLSVVCFEPEEPPPQRPPPHTPSAKPVPCLRCLCCTSLTLDLCPLQGAKPGLLGLLPKDC